MKKNSHIGKTIACKFCKSPDAIIQLIDRRLMVYCLHCASRGKHEYLLKEQRTNSTPEQIGEILAREGLVVK
jgi:translation initiation factor 2 beta subunit (eIF-2beta)/eIF-5